jgi:ribosomal protein S18 acetylase RimI-like enzyme
MTEISIHIDPFPEKDALDRLWHAAWGQAGYPDPKAILSRSLVHLGAYSGEHLIGFVNVAWDGGVHAFLLDPCVDPEFRRSGIGTRLVGEAARLAAQRGGEWLHVDFEPHLAAFYNACGFRSTEAGLMRLTRD